MEKELKKKIEKKEDAKRIGEGPVPYCPRPDDSSKKSFSKIREKMKKK